MSHFCDYLAVFTPRPELPHNPLVLQILKGTKIYSLLSPSSQTYDTAKN